MSSIASLDANLRSVIAEHHESVFWEHPHGEWEALTRCTDAHEPPLHSLQKTISQIIDGAMQWREHMKQGQQNCNKLLRIQMMCGHMTAGFIVRYSLNCELCKRVYTHPHPEGWSWTLRLVPHQRSAGGARRQESPLLRAPPAACSWWPQVRLRAVSNVPTMAPTSPSAGDKG